jgi:hypothetical protein
VDARLAGVLSFVYCCNAQVVYSGLGECDSECKNDEVVRSGRKESAR